MSREFDYGRIATEIFGIADAPSPVPDIKRAIAFILSRTFGELERERVAWQTIETWQRSAREYYQIVLMPPDRAGDTYDVAIEKPHDMFVSSCVVKEKTRLEALEAAAAWCAKEMVR